jgi:hypothetical protein
VLASLESRALLAIHVELRLIEHALVGRRLPEHLLQQLQRKDDVLLPLRRKLPHLHKPHRVSASFSTSHTHALTEAQALTEAVYRGRHRLLQTLSARRRHTLLQRH